MNEGGLIQLYARKNNMEEADLASNLNIEQNQLHDLYESQTVDPEIKEKLKQYFKRNIFDGTFLEEISKAGSVPDQSKTTSK